MNRLIGVHGFSFAPGVPGYDPKGLFAAWAAMVLRPVDGFAWYSAPLGFGGEAKALARGYADEYAWAFKELAPAAGQALAEKIRAAGAPIDVVCHSLGSKVVRVALEALPPGAVESLLVLDGAEVQKDAKGLARAGTVLNVAVRSDLVLRDLGSRFNGEVECPCIGQGGLGFSAPNVCDVFLDDPATQDRAAKSYAFALSGAMPGLPLTGDVVADLRRRGDHWASYLDVGNWGLYRAFYGGFDPAVLAG